MCEYCNIIQNGLTSLKKYDKDKESIRRELYMKFDDAFYELDQNDFLKIMDIFSYRKNNMHAQVMSAAIDLYIKGCQRTK
ncbi:hypothetical protein DN757_01630 [Paenibacillus silvae]|uniref:Uncharacterized protein n=1 Tax=Paenibacillus silvae TaxID=1325358 RepID=A0A2W6NNG6_9BACL|nr:hypothetical protein DN757_01630 [Paenibacillus silvae]